jgi:ABC-type nitrate/sulfonate/bicarbonate transport system ATPase subunit
MDEPFSHLDELTARSLRAEILRIWTGARRPVLFVTHNALEAVYLGDRVLVLSGRPTTVVKDLAVRLPRDRAMEDLRLVELQRLVLDTLGVTTGTSGG